MNKKAQITIFMIVGVVLLITLGSVFYLVGRNNLITKSTVSIESEKIQLSSKIQDCIRTETKEAVDLYGLNYWSSEQEISAYLNKNLPDCVYTKTLMYQGLGVKEKNVTANASISDSVLSLDVNYPITLEKQDVSANVGRFVYDLLIKENKTILLDENGFVAQDTVIELKDAGVKLEIPKGTLMLDMSDVEERIATINNIKLDVKDKLIGGDDIIIGGLIYELTPDGARFDPALSISIPYDENLIPKEYTEEDLTISYFDKDLKKWVDIETKIDKTRNVLTANITHFSAYAPKVAEDRLKLIGIQKKSEYCEALIKDITANAEYCVDAILSGTDFVTNNGKKQYLLPNSDQFVRRSVDTALGYDSCGSFYFNLFWNMNKNEFVASICGWPISGAKGVQTLKDYRKLESDTGITSSGGLITDPKYKDNSIVQEVTWCRALLLNMITGKKQEDIKKEVESRHGSGSFNVKKYPFTNVLNDVSEKCKDNLKYKLWKVTDVNGKVDYGCLPAILDMSSSTQDGLKFDKMAEKEDGSDIICTQISVEKTQEDTKIDWSSISLQAQGAVTQAETAVGIGMRYETCTNLAVECVKKIIYNSDGSVSDQNGNENLPMAYDLASLNLQTVEDAKTKLGKVEKCPDQLADGVTCPGDYCTKFDNVYENELCYIFDKELYDPTKPTTEQQKGCPDGTTIQPMHCPGGTNERCCVRTEFLTAITGGTGILNIVSFSNTDEIKTKTTEVLSWDAETYKCKENPATDADKTTIKTNTETLKQDIDTIASIMSSDYWESEKTCGGTDQYGKFLEIKEKISTYLDECIRISAKNNIQSKVLDALVKAEKLKLADTSASQTDDGVGCCYSGSTDGKQFFYCIPTDKKCYKNDGTESSSLYTSKSCDSIKAATWTVENTMCVKNTGGSSAGNSAQQNNQVVSQEKNCCCFYNSAGSYVGCPVACDGSCASKDINGDSINDVMLSTNSCDEIGVYNNNDACLNT